MQIGNIRRNMMYPMLKPTSIGLHTENPSRLGNLYELLSDGRYERQPVECEIINNEVVTKADVDVPISGGSLVKYISYWDDLGYIGCQIVGTSSFGSDGVFRLLAGTAIVL